ncbi:glycosyltransferase [Streptomyces dysideae]|uniref:Glycosyl transferase family 28 C-terminal domain-containing protein n=1 Tax=Streptomyces dysideae TaxID=909626 RepID=A0A101V1J7_9ACTN|nr:glycosyltransferase [Streptomyces dysideae]KUO20768.1 hypothetical protein AQJ91_12725 [Streptomyces dysideae]
MSSRSPTSSSPADGAGTIAELTALRKPSVLIPLATSAGNEQEHNAFQLQQAGATVALVKETATAKGLRTAVAPVLTSPEWREQILNLNS